MGTKVISLGGSIISPSAGHVNAEFLKDFQKLIQGLVETGSKFVILCGGGKIARQYQQAALYVLSTKEAEVVNNADSLVFSSEKLFTEMEGKVDAAKLEDVKTEIAALKKLLEPDQKDMDAIKKKTEEINQKLQAMSTEMYQKVAEEQAKQQKAGAGPAGGADPGASPGNDKPKDDNVVDADFKEDKKKS